MYHVSSMHVVSRSPPRPLRFEQYRSFVVILKALAPPSRLLLAHITLSQRTLTVWTVLVTCAHATVDTAA